MKCKINGLSGIKDEQDLIQKLKNINSAMEKLGAPFYAVCSNRKAEGERQLTWRRFSDSCVPGAINARYASEKDVEVFMKKNCNAALSRIKSSTVEYAIEIVKKHGKYSNEKKEKSNGRTAGNDSRSVSKSKSGGKKERSESKGSVGKGKRAFRKENERGKATQSTKPECCAGKKTNSSTEKTNGKTEDLHVQKTEAKIEKVIAKIEKAETLSEVEKAIPEAKETIKEIKQAEPQYNPDNDPEVTKQLMTVLEQLNELIK
jgi:hypothetical protein